ncbi:MAG: hypothetical protein ABL907_25255, partial [Hyphomicrobium sp.]
MGIELVGRSELAQRDAITDFRSRRPVPKAKRTSQMGSTEPSLRPSSMTAISASRHLDGVYI